MDNLKEVHFNLNVALHMDNAEWRLDALAEEDQGACQSHVVYDVKRNLRLLYASLTRNAGKLCTDALASSYGPH
jgi:hypothetical protein